MLDIGAEDIAVRGFFDGHGCDHAAQTHRPNDGHDLPATARGGFVDAPATFAARIKARHRSGASAVIQEYQLFGGDRGQTFYKVLALLTVRFCVSLGRVERLFLRRSLNFCSRYQIWGALSEIPTS